MLKKFAYMILALSAAAFAGNGHELVIAEPYPDETGEVKVAEATYVGGLVEKGETVKLLVQPKTGYVLDSLWAVSMSIPNTVELTKESDNIYSFVMTDAKVTVYSLFKKGSYTVTVNGCTLLDCPDPVIKEFGSSVSVVIKKGSNFKGQFEIGLIGLGEGAVTSSSSNTSEGTEYTYTFTMPGNDVTFNMTEKLSEAPTRYEISFVGCDSLTCVAPDSANVGDEVTIVIVDSDSAYAANVGFSGIGEVVKQRESGDSAIYVVKIAQSDAVVTVTSKTQLYLVSVQNAQDGSISYTGETNVKYGSKVSFTVTPDENYEIDFVKVVNADKQSVSFTPTKKNGAYTYKVPGYNTIIVAGFKAVAASSSSGTGSQDGDSSNSQKDDPSSSSSDSQNPSSSEDNGYYCIDIIPDENGDIQMADSFSKQYKNCTLEGNEVTLGVYPESGYTLESFSVKKKNGDKVKLEQEGSTYKFKMPASDVTVKATYKVGEYEVKVEGCGDLKCEVSKTKAKAGDDIKVTITLVAGYTGFTLSATGIGSLDRKDSGAKTTLSFTMPGNDVTITVEPEGKSSTVTSSSSGKEGGDSKSSSSSGKSGKSSSSKGGKDAIHVSAQLPQFNVMAADRQILVSGVPAGADYFLLDINGRVMSQGCSVAQDFAIAVPRAGYYLLRVGNTVRTVNVQ